jgi:hypothetical protein
MSARPSRAAAADAGLGGAVFVGELGEAFEHDAAQLLGALDAVGSTRLTRTSTRWGSRGIGEIGIVGAAAAIANAAYHASGIRTRDLPLTADKFLM